MKKVFLILTLMAVTFFIACSKKAHPAKVRPTTYTMDIAPLLQAKCTPCHLPSRGGRKANFETYESAKGYAAEMLDRVMIAPGQRGFMPQKNEKLPETEIALIKKWIDQGLLEK